MAEKRAELHLDGWPQMWYPRLLPAMLTPVDRSDLRQENSMMSAPVEGMRDRVCLVTGATAGIGLVTARVLAQQGATVLGVGRNPAKADAVRERLRRESGNPRIDILLADLSSQAEVRRLAEEVRRRCPRLDVLVNNAGGFFMWRQRSVDGIEMTLALNYLGPFLLTHLLLDALKASPAGRVVNVASDSHRGARLDLGDLQSSRGYFGMRAYGRSKLALVLFTYELARRLTNTSLTANAVHPGFVATDLAKNNGMLFRIVMPLLRPFALSAEEGAETSIYVASSAEVAGISGKYFAAKRPVPSDPASYDEAVAASLWEISAQMTGLA